MQEVGKLNKLAVLGVFVAGMWFCSGDQSAQAQSATDKLGRGLANTFLGVFEVPNQVINTYRENTGKYIANRDRATVKAISVGTVKGVREGIRRTSHGIWDTITFLSPGPGGNNFKSRIKPEYITETYDY